MQIAGLTYEQSGELKGSKHFNFLPILEVYAYYNDVLESRKKGVASDRHLVDAALTVVRAERDLPAYMARSQLINLGVEGAFERSAFDLKAMRDQDEHNTQKLGNLISEMERELDELDLLDDNHCVVQ